MPIVFGSQTLKGRYVWTVGWSRVVRMFTVPKGVASGVQVAYALITNLLLTAEIYTMIATPFSAVMVAAFVHLWKTNEDFRNKVRVI